MKNVIITGATSFLGIYLTNELLCRGCKVTAVVRKDSNNLDKLPKHGNLSIVLSNLFDRDYIKKIVNNKKFDIFYHLAWGGTRAPQRDDRLLQDSNYEATINALKLAIELGCSTFIGTGSQAEYGICMGKISENYPMHPVTEYGKAKLRACQDSMKLAIQNDLNFIWTRIFSLYGDNDYSGTLIMSSLKKMLNNEPILLTECIQNWDFLHVKDAVSALIMLGEKKCDLGIYNLASGSSRPLKEFVLQMKKITNSTSELNFGAVSYGREGIISFEPVVDKLKRTIPWQPIIQLDDGIQEILKNMKQREKNENY
ncbi:NAD(P)-dependent oxidoreductase [Pelosinus sp. UFO1]|uniref:NAD-dependent epimerase/dehydratase family protein n=1 Tax=Pelosinus sp. UFO1 TaxID=484770 RepID=UPI0004D17F78|nr:NAD(P)-dependent oxidoreductase [Pelosinus sp. UFO1]AIF53725.1 NAD-dependent epimerase/dehydratase [Pelosinus sp. UFO1]